MFVLSTYSYFYCKKEIRSTSFADFAHTRKCWTPKLRVSGWTRWHGRLLTPHARPFFFFYYSFLNNRETVENFGGSGGAAQLLQSFQWQEKLSQNAAVRIRWRCVLIHDHWQYSHIRSAGEIMFWKPFVVNEQTKYGSILIWFRIWSMMFFTSNLTIWSPVNGLRVLLELSNALSVTDYWNWCKFQDCPILRRWYRQNYDEDHSYQQDYIPHQDHSTNATATPNPNVNIIPCALPRSTSTPNRLQPQRSPWI